MVSTLVAVRDDGEVLRGVVRAVRVCCSAVRVSWARESNG